ncbi:MAG: enoyl-CoA hydratase/isomerase family protein [SAR202 cluster bacterium]|nr:enoyl-CoA hydratase/isomerase family protein [SAR202 cluster bacterium]
MEAFDTILYLKDGHVATITLNRPQIRNAFDTRMRDDLWQALEAVRDDTDVKCVVLNGAGFDFCAGADLTEFGAAPSLSVAREVRWERDIWGLFLDMAKPLIASIHGHCIGSGLEMAMLCDIRIVSYDAKFSMPETHLGLIPAAGGTQTISRAIGLAPALELLLTGHVVGAEEASKLGLATKVVSVKSLQAETLNLADRLASLDSKAAAGLKEAIHRGADLPLDRSLELERRLALKLLTTQPS